MNLIGKILSWEPSLWTLMSQVQVVWSKKNHCHFHLSTVTFKHVPRININIWHMKWARVINTTDSEMRHVTSSQKSPLSFHMKAKVAQHGLRINKALSHLTCDMCNVTCESMTNSYLWAYMKRQKLFSMS